MSVYGGGADFGTGGAEEHSGAFAMEQTAIATTPSPGTGICLQGGPAPSCPAGQTAVWSSTVCAWVCSGAAAEAPTEEGDLWSRVGDILGGLGGGGGFIAPPQPAAPTVGLVPAERSKANLWAILFLLIAAGAGAYYYYQRKKRAA